MKPFITVITRNLYRRAIYLRHSGPTSSSFSCCPNPSTARLFSTSGDDHSKKSEARNTEDSKKLTAVNVEDPKKSSEKTEGQAKPGKFGVKVVAEKSGGESKSEKSDGKSASGKSVGQSASEKSAGQSAAQKSDGQKTKPDAQPSSKSDGQPDPSKIVKASELNLAKPGGLGKAGELRKALEAESALDQSDEKKRRPLRGAALSAKTEDDSSTSDDELMSSESSSDDDRGEEPKEKDKPSQLLSPTIRQSVKDVSKALGGDERRTRLDLLKKLIHQEKESYEASKLEEAPTKEDKSDAKKGKSEAKKSTASLGSLLDGMKVQRGIPPEKIGRPTRLRAGEQLVQKYKKVMKDGEVTDERVPLPRRPMEKSDEAKQYPRTDLFDRGPGLGIFIPVANKLKSSPPLLPVWENLERRRLKLLTSQEPRNGFEEMVRWTEEGKMYPYPIDNDYGHVELNVPFHEHVFLEDQLEIGFPKTGPVSIFMELVVHGLSSNPYMSVEKKQGHIAWFREYFQKRGAEIEKLHALDLKHQQALAEIDQAAADQSKNTVRAD